MAYTGLLSIAGISTLEEESVLTLASIVALEKEAQQTFAELSEVQTEAYGVSAALSTLEKESLSSFAFISSLEKEEISSIAIFSELQTEYEVISALATFSALEKPAKSVFAIFADLVYYTTPSSSLKPEIIDRRAESNAKPIYRGKYTLSLPLGNTAISNRSFVNLEVKQITFGTPDLDGGTAKVQLIDEIGAVLYESGSKAEKTTTALSPTSSIPLAGWVTVKVIASKAQSTAVSFVVVLYGV